MAVTFDDITREFLNRKNFAVLTTLDRHGSPQSSVIWYKLEGDTTLFTTLDGRQKARNLQRDRRVSLLVLDKDDAYRTIEIRGTATLMPDPERALSKELTQAYVGQDPPVDPEGQLRLIVRISPKKVVRFSA